MVAKSFYIILVLMLVIGIPLFIIIIQEYGFQSWVVWFLLFYSIWITIHIYSLSKVRRNDNSD